MPVCFDRKLAFVHIPKTGGSSVARLLGLDTEEHFYEANYAAYTFNGVTYAPQHLTASLLGTLIPNFSVFTTFCFTRHPYEKVVSEYFWLRRDREARPVRLFWEWRFRRWMKNELARKDMDHKLDQWLYAKDCDHVFSFETMNEQWPSIARVLGAPPEATLPRLLTGRQDSRRIARSLSERSKRIIQDLYPDDFDRLGYTR